MPEAIKTYVRWVDAFNHKVGLIAMYMIFAMIAILFYSAISKSFFTPSLWTLELAQFAMVTYFLLGGGYSIQTNSHVRMDLLYDRWSPRTKASVDAVTALFMLFYVCLLLYGGYSSTSYALQYDEHSYSSWAPRMAPVKIIMVFGIFLMLLQVVATFFRNVAEALGKDIT